jgi:hypothetical protein
MNFTIGCPAPVLGLKNRYGTLLLRLKAHCLKTLKTLKIHVHFEDMQQIAATFFRGAANRSAIAPFLRVSKSHHYTLLWPGNPYIYFICGNNNIIIT